MADTPADEKKNLNYFMFFEKTTNMYQASRREAKNTIEQDDE